MKSALLSNRRRGESKAERRGVQERVTFENLEPRQFLSVSEFLHSYISDIGSYNLYSQASMGDNGYPDGIPGVYVGVSDSANQSAYREWDSDLSDGLDSGWVAVSFTATLGSTNTAQFSVGGAGTTYYSGGSATAISEVDIRAAVAGPDMAMSWSNLSVAFYQGSSLVETVSLGNDVAVSTIGSQTWDPAEMIAQITPTQSNCDKVVVTGSIRLQAAAGTYPGPNDIFGQVFIHG